MIPIVQGLVVPRTIIWSDEWAYAVAVGTCIKRWITASISEDPVPGVCANDIEAYWHAVKRRLKSMVGTTAEMVPPSRLDKFLWRERFGSTMHLARLHVLRHIAERYPVWAAVAEQWRTAQKKNQLFSEPPTYSRRDAKAYVWLRVVTVVISA